MNKKYVLGSLLILALTMTGCNTTPGGNSNSSADKSSDGSIIQPSKDPSEITGGVFGFNDEELNTAQEIHTANQLKYLNLEKDYYDMTKSDLDACDALGNKNVSTPEKTKLNWTFEAPNGYEVKNYTLVFSQSMDLSDPYVVQGTKDTSISFYNSFLGTNYFKIVANFTTGDKQSSDVMAFKVTERAPRNLYVGNMPNCRDMGGRTTYAGGKIKQGLIYRTSGSKFDNRTDSDAEAKDILLNQLRVKTEINVANSTSNNVGLSGTNVENAYMAYGAVPYSNLARNSVRIRQVMDILADEDNYPVFYHCRIGTDRTGITGIMINGLLGVPFNEALQDYGFSNFAPIDNQRYPNKPNDTNGDDIVKYIDELLALPGANFQEQVYLALRMIGVPAAKLDKIIDIMTYGTKATIPATAKIGEGDGLTSDGSKSTSSDFKAPATYYGIGSGKKVSFTTTTTAGQKDVIVYMGYTGSVSNNNNQDKLADSITLTIDGQEKTISSTKNLWTAGFGATQQDSRIGYMFNILGNYEFTAGEHTVEIVSKKSTFNVGSVTVADRA
ncbi:MAG: tyrosine-protein phosphatase [Bacilli bacterium]|nr:tyrosine-protein phosphatase [Bacilli bacterium]